MKHLTYDDIFVNDRNTRSFRPILSAVTGDSDRAIIVNQIEFYMSLNEKTQKTSKVNHFHDGKWWTFNTLEEWHKEFWWLSPRTLRRHLKALRDQGILIADNSFNAKDFDKTLWYTIDREVVVRLCNEKYQELVSQGLLGDDASEENSMECEENVGDYRVSKMATSECPEWTERDVQNGQTNTRYKPISDINNISDINKKKSKGGKSGGSLSCERTVKSDFSISLEKSLKNLEKADMESEDRKEMAYIIEYFFSALHVQARTVHHVLSVGQIQTIYDNLTNLYDNLCLCREEVKYQIHRYFNDFGDRDGTDLTMEHFASPEILKIGDSVMQRQALLDEGTDYINLHRLLREPTEGIRPTRRRVERA